MVKRNLYINTNRTKKDSENSESFSFLFIPLDVDGNVGIGARIFGEWLSTIRIGVECEGLIYFPVG